MKFYNSWGKDPDMEHEGIDILWLATIGLFFWIGGLLYFFWPTIIVTNILIFIWILFNRNR